MAPNILHLPNGQTITVTSVYGGLYFKNNDLSTHQQSHMPPGWTIVLHSEDDEDEKAKEVSVQIGSEDEDNLYRQSESHIHRYRRPTLRNDAVFISSISNPSSNDFKPAVSQTRGIAMMLWATLWWYFHQPQPAPQYTSPASAQTAETGKPHGEWRIRIKREGIFKAKHLLPKLERMGLVATDISSVGVEDERHNKAWDRVFISQRAFWQIDARIFLFTLSPTHSSPFMPSTPMSSRPSSPSRGEATGPAGTSSRPSSMTAEALSGGLWSPSLASGPFSSSSHLPTYYPPHPAQYIFTKGIRHPLRPKPPRQGETIYTRYIPSLGQYLSFRVASLSTEAVPHKGPTGSAFGAGMTFGSSTGHTPAITPPGAGTPQPSFLPPLSAMRTALHSPPLQNQASTASPCDIHLLNRWHNDPRVAAAWGENGPMSQTESFLRTALSSKHSFPVIGCFDGKPFGYFELYWAKEDQLGPYIDRGKAGDWDRGIHALVGEQEFRGPHRVKVWLSALVHYFWLQDLRTEHVWCEPRVDNSVLINYLQDVGFRREGDVSFPHKQAALMGISRDTWVSPAL